MMSLWDFLIRCAYLTRGIMKSRYASMQDCFAHSNSGLVSRVNLVVNMTLFAGWQIHSVRFIRANVKLP